MTASLFTGCGKKSASITQAEQTLEKSRNFLADIEEVKAIAEESFIYGLPLVMNYTANYEFWVDKTSTQYKSGFNELVNERRVFTCKDTTVVTPDSDTPYSFACLDLRAEHFVVSVTAVEKARYNSLQFVDWNIFNYGCVGSRAMGTEAGDYLVVGPDWKSETPAGIKGVLHRQRNSQLSFSARSFLGRTICRMLRRCRRATRFRSPSWRLPSSEQDELQYP